MSRPRVIRCAACAGRIKPQHPHIGVMDLEKGEAMKRFKAFVFGKAAA